MANITNGTDAALYRAQYCDECIHGPNCAVWTAHELYSYDVADGGPGREILDLLIPETGGTPQQCTLYIPAGYPVPDGIDNVLPIK